MIPKLELRFEPDSDGTGELFASASCEQFAGAGSAWFSEGEIQAFGEALQACYPMAPGTELRLEGGYWESGCSPAKLKDVLLGIRIYPLGSLGHIGVHLQLGEGTSDQRRPESRAWASFELMANYEDLRRFGVQILSLLKSPGTSASLYQSAN